MQTIESWLDENNLGQYFTVFRDNDIDFDTLPELTDSDIKELGLSLGHRVRLRKCIETLTAQTAQGDNATDTSPASVAAAAERRQLTIMFIYLDNATRLSNQLDPEEFHQLLSRFHSIISAVLKRHNGFVARITGSSSLVYFGWPEIAEDDVRRSMRAALEITRNVAQMSSPIGGRLSVRIGIATGLAVVGEIIGSGDSEEFAVVGEAPNLAARLGGLSVDGNIMVSHHSRQLARHYFSFADGGLVDIKGFSEPVRVWTLLSEMSAIERQYFIADSTTTQLQQRDEETYRLKSRWGRALGGNGQTVLLCGEAGIGKSRLTTAAIEMVGEDSTVVQFHCASFNSNTSLHPVVEQLKTAAGIKYDDADSSKLEKLEEFLRIQPLNTQHNAPQVDHPQDNPAMTLLAELLSIDTGGRYERLNIGADVKKDRTLELLVDLLVARSNKHPALVVFEDLHWCDPSTLELIDCLIDAARHTPMLLLLTYRPEFQPQWGDEAHISTILLNRLDTTASESLIKDISGNAQLPQALIDQIIGKSDGLPLHIEELTAAVIESAPVVDENGRYVVDDTSELLVVPETLHDSLMARLDKMSRSRNIAQIASTIGREFSWKLLEHIADSAQPEIEFALRRLIEARLISQRNSIPNAKFTFKHALIRDAAYNSLLLATRQQLHEKIATTLLQHFPQTASNNPELLAHHYHYARNWSQATACFLKAGQLATARSAHVEAESLYRQGLKLINNIEGDAERQQQELGLQVSLGTTLLSTRGYTDAELGEAFERAYDICRDMGDPPEVFPVLFGLWAYHFVLTDFERSLSIATQILHLAEQQSDPAFLIVAYEVCGLHYCWAGQLAPAQEYLQKCDALYQHEQHSSLGLTYGQDPKGASLAFLSWVQWFQGYPDQAVETAKRAISHSRKISHPYTLAYALGSVSVMYELTGDLVSAEACATECVEISLEQGFVLWAAQGNIIVGICQIADHGKMNRIVSESVAAYRAVGTGVGVAYYSALKAKTLTLLDRPEEALEILEWCCERVEKSGESWITPELQRMRGDTMKQLAQDRASVETVLTQALDLAREQQSRSFELRAATSLAHFYAEDGKNAEAVQILEPVYQWFTEGLDTKDLISARELLQQLR